MVTRPDIYVRAYYRMVRGVLQYVTSHFRSRPKR